MKGHRKAKPKKEVARPVASTAVTDARIRELRTEYKREVAGIMGAAARRREREKPRNFQKILLWEMDQIRHAEARFRASKDRLLKGLPPLEESQKPAEFKAKAIDKRPSQKEAKLSY